MAGMVTDVEEGPGGVLPAEVQMVHAEPSSPPLLHDPLVICPSVTDRARVLRYVLRDGDAGETWYVWDGKS